jgi:hypothetical protein
MHMTNIGTSSTSLHTGNLGGSSTIESRVDAATFTVRQFTLGSC